MMGYWHDMSGWDYVWMVGMMIFWVALLVGVVWGTVTLVRGDRSTGAQPSAKDDLDRRLAQGDITEEDYKRRRDLISSA